MGVDRAVHASGAPPRAIAHDGPSGGRERGAVYRDERLSVAHAASGVSARLDCAAVFPGCVTSSPTVPYGGPKPRDALKHFGDWTIEIVKRSDKAKGFEVPPRRWVVERTFAWLGRCRGPAKDWEKSIASSEAWIHIAHIRLTSRRLAR